jgi:PhzF family phenazine biosynthesis protein
MIMRYFRWIRPIESYFHTTPSAMSRRLAFTTLDVFTSMRFSGNPLAIVHLPGSINLSQEQKQLIAREFNLSETVFLHESPAESPSIAAIDIFTKAEELPFAGHPTVGTSWYLLSRNEQLTSATIRTKAGNIAVSRGASGTARIKVPMNFKIHASFAHPGVKPLQPRLKYEDYANGLDAAEPVVSIVKGMTFIFLQLSNRDALSRLQPFPSRLAMPEGYLNEWEGFVGLYAFFEQQDGTIQTRMFDGALEDAATGSAASALAGWLAEKRGRGTWRIDIVQGVEMGQRSEITVFAEVGNDDKLNSVEMEGGAVKMMEGWLEV